MLQSTNELNRNFSVDINLNVGLVLSFGDVQERIKPETIIVTSMPGTKTVNRLNDMGFLF
jgi:hypothetical protein